MVKMPQVSFAPHVLRKTPVLTPSSLDSVMRGNIFNPTIDTHLSNPDPPFSNVANNNYARFLYVCMYVLVCVSSSMTTRRSQSFPLSDV